MPGPRRKMPCCAVTGAFLFVSAVVAFPARATQYLVETYTDDLTDNGNCTLREAVRAANSDAAVDACPAGSGADVIYLAGTYTLSIAGDNEDAAATGDLDLTDDVSIGALLIYEDYVAAIVDAAGLDRAFHVLPGVAASFDHVSITGGQVSSAGPTYDGGGILSQNAATVLETCVVEGNRSNYAGGGVAAIDGSLVIRDSAIDDNRCNFGTGALGCGISVHGTGAAAATLVLENSTVSANRNQYGFGFAIGVKGAGAGATTATIRNTTISGNLGDAATCGGLLVEDAAGGGAGKTSADLNNVTIAENTDVGVYALANVVGDARIDVRNSIVADNATYDCEGQVYSGGHNVVGDAVPPFVLANRVCDFSDSTGDRVVSDPGLEALDFNEVYPDTGVHRTHALLPGSPALDAASRLIPGSGGAACEASDQRGVPRFLCDAGAYEEESSCPSTTSEWYWYEPCRQAYDGTLQIKDRFGDGPGSGDKLVWTYRADGQTLAGDFGDPTTAPPPSSYLLCVYDNAGQSLVAEARVDSAGTCAGRDCWTQKDGDYKFIDTQKTQDGTRKILLKTGEDVGDVNIRWQSAGAGMRFRGLPLSSDVGARLYRYPHCWDTYFSLFSIEKNSSEQFKASLY